MNFIYVQELLLAKTVICEKLHGSRIVNTSNNKKSQA